MSDDPVLNYVTLSNDNYLYEEERRLFYVALTRTKTKCILLVPDIKPSIFAKEILNDKNLVVDDSMIKDNSVLFNPGCPICKSGRLLLRVNNKDKSRFVSCTNYPRCFFSTKYVTVLEDEIMTCPSCNSYLVKKNGKYGEFYGCLNYPECNQSVDIEDHYDFKRE
jgi:DNA helicase-4